MDNDVLPLTDDVWFRNTGIEQKCPECKGYVMIFKYKSKISFEYHLKAWGKTRGKDWIIACEGKPNKRLFKQSYS